MNRAHKQVWETAVQARATHMHVNLHVTATVATQGEDPILKTTLSGSLIGRYRI